ncbi:cytochrome p450 [Moniliophthora roreri MCA 2997]|uniref:Cytochrome p450 n=2 Tax=Moniliophthora roreri TaxID=221103 RepID=V2WGS4_MONRO|nr:cytochrome p450 [Moniliophthora roreri MCA 2997]
MPMLPYGSAWKKQWRLANLVLSIAAVKKYHVLQSQIMAMFLQSLIEKLKKYANELHLATGHIVINVTYELLAKTPNDLINFTWAGECLNIVSRGSMPGAFIVDLIPALRYLPSWLPGVTFHKAGQEGWDKIQHLIERPFNYVKSQMEAGTARLSLTLDCMENFEALNKKAVSTKEKEHVIQWTSGCMYAASNLCYPHELHPHLHQVPRSIEEGSS